MLKSMRYFFAAALMYLSLLSCKAQAPEGRPDILEPSFDQRLTTLLSFTVPLIGVEELRAHSDEYLILDTREEEEYSVSHIPGARHLGYAHFDPLSLQNIPKDQPIVLYCSVGYRSEKIGEKLRKQGFTKVYNLYGSIFEWANRGYPLITSDGGATRQLHTYNRNWSQYVNEGAAKKVW